MTKYVYFKSGINIIRAPRKDFDEGVLDVNNIEVLMYDGKKNDSYFFTRNSLSRSIAESEEIFLLKPYTDETLKTLYNDKKEKEYSNITNIRYTIPINSWPINSSPNKSVNLLNSFSCNSRKIKLVNSKNMHKHSRRRKTTFQLSKTKSHNS